MKQIFFALLCFLLLTIEFGNAETKSDTRQCSVCGKIYTKTKYNFCIIDGAPLTDQKLMIVNPVKKEVSLLKSANIANFKNQKTIEEFHNDQLKQNITDNVKLNIYDYEKTMAAINKFWDSDLALTFYLLNYLYQKYPEDLDVMKKLADYYFKMEEYSRASEILEKVENILNQKLEKFETKK